eukprot:8334765-Pyramimonas_sp.AAC.1
MARLKANSAGFNGPNFQILMPILFRALGGWRLPSSAAIATAQPPDAPHPATARSTPGAHAQQWALG